ncbi:MAG TPA: phosphate signaling complex protein PhoU [Ilumatobacter sp.]|nr:phosphate signaling complex protein PhoU [Ilumatobacter sp.]
MSDELRVAFHTELEAIRGEIVQLASAVRDAIGRATTVLLTGDFEAARLLIFWDDEIDARAIELEERCGRVLALQAPVAVDLRLVLAVIRITAEIERTADLLVNICKTSVRIGRPLPAALHADLLAMSEQATELHTAAIYAFAADDADQAETLDEQDSALDNSHRAFVQSLHGHHSAGDIDLDTAIQVAIVARFYERIGDHAVNIAERVRYHVIGGLPHHVGATRYRTAHPRPIGTEGDEHHLPDG